MRPILELRGLGYRVTLDGEKIRWEWRGTGTPPKKTASVYLGDIKEHRAEALTFLRDERKSTAPVSDGDEVTLSKAAQTSLRQEPQKQPALNKPISVVQGETDDILRSLKWEEKHSLLEYFKILQGWDSVKEIAQGK